MKSVHERLEQTIFRKMTDAVRIAVRCRPSTKKELSDNEHVADMAQLKENVSAPNLSMYRVRFETATPNKF